MQSAEKEKLMLNFKGELGALRGVLLGYAYDWGRRYYKNHRLENHSECIRVV